MFALVIQSGCATLSREECLRADWARIGREDGVRGYPGERIEDHRKACGEFGVSPDPSAYRKGRADGLMHYCTLAGGYEQGKSGASYRYVCPRELEAEFMRGFRTGTQIYELNQQITQLDGKIKAKEKELEKDKLPEEQRRSLRDRIRDLERERNNLRSHRLSIERMTMF
ncbi:MAG: DUF2799 domain-containing protein [Sulfuricellaceae bacterium]